MKTHAAKIEKMAVELHKALKGWFTNDDTLVIFLEVAHTGIYKMPEEFMKENIKESYTKTLKEEQNLIIQKRLHI